MILASVFDRTMLQCSPFNAMKRCPECRRDYYDDSLLYCLDRGTPLLDGPSSLQPKLSGSPAQHDVETAVLEVGHDDRNRLAADATVPGRSIHTAETQRINTEQLRSANRPSRHNARSLIIGSLITIVLAAAVFGFYEFGLRRKLETFAFKNTKISKLTTEGNVDTATVAPDGKYIAYVTIEGRTCVLWTKHLATNSRVQIAASPEGGVLYASEFSPDGSYVYYGLQSEEKAGFDLYQVPVLGGTGKKVLTDITIVLASCRWRG